MAIPIACTLSAADLSRRRELFAGVRATCRRVETDEHGVRLTFDAAEGILSRLADLIDMERVCCRFLDFRLEVAPDGGPVTLTMSGPPGTAAFLHDELGLEASA
jgi:hypothetical protein